MNLSEGDLICFGKGGIGIDECVVSAMEKGDSVLMDDGRIEAVASHEELLKISENYRYMNSLQMKGGAVS